MRYYQTRWQPLCFFPHALHKLAYWMVSLPLGKSFLSGENADLLRRHSLGQEYFMSSAIAFYEGEKGKVLSSSFRSKMQKEDSFDVVRPLYTRFRQKVENPSFLQLLTFIELNLRLPELLLMRTDKTGMANSVEIRVPFLDHKLIEFALSVPESFKIRNGVPKEPLKRMAAKYVPKDLIYRPKVGFWAPIREWFGGKLGEAFREMLCKKNDNVDVYFNRTALLRMLTQEKITSQSAVQLWGVFNFLKWKGYVDGK
jgi:asparagine synthase (glutamine-hydrolysing)